MCDHLHENIIIMIFLEEISNVEFCTFKNNFFITRASKVRLPPQFLVPKDAFFERFWRFYKTVRKRKFSTQFCRNSVAKKIPRTVQVYALNEQK